MHCSLTHTRLRHIFLLPISSNMELFTYEPLQLEEPSFRLIRLIQGRGPVIHGDLIHASRYDAEDAMEYEALSYTWGRKRALESIRINGKGLNITANLLQAMHHLRYRNRDRVLWIDAICIDQGNHAERGHQVRQMPAIYGNARQVVFWLGTATADTDLLFSYMRQFQKRMLEVPCGDWTPEDHRWQANWSTVRIPEYDRLDYEHGTRRHSHEISQHEASIRARCCSGMEHLLSQSWFDRIWIVQEVANARRATVMCGWKSVSARIFAVVPTVLDMTVTASRRVIFDIMPGPSRKHSWWIEERDLYTLLVKFRLSKASDGRDNIYALLGISSAAYSPSTLAPDYSKDLTAVIQTTIDFVVGARFFGVSCVCQRRLHLSTILQTYPDWRCLREHLLVKAFAREHKNTLHEFEGNLFTRKSTPGARSEYLSKTLLDVEYTDQHWRTSYVLTEDVLSLAISEHNGWGLLLNTEQWAIDYMDDLAQEGRILTPLLWAASRGREDAVRLLLSTRKVDVNERNRTTRETPLLLAVKKGLIGIVELLLQCQDLDIDARDADGTTALLAAISKSHAIAELILATGRADIHAQCKKGMSPLGAALTRRAFPLAEMLLKLENIDVDAWSPAPGMVPLDDLAEFKRIVRHGINIIEAVDEGDSAQIKMLLEQDRIDVNTPDQSGRTPLGIAAKKSDMTVLEVLLKSKRTDVNCYSRHCLSHHRENFDGTPLGLAAYGGNLEVVCRLLKVDNIDVNLADDSGATPLTSAVMFGWKPIVRLLLASGKANVNTPDNRETPLTWAIKQEHVSIAAMLLEYDGIDVNLQNSRGKTPLALAVERRMTTLVRIILKSGRYILRGSDFTGLSLAPLHPAVGRGYEGIADLLIAHGARTVARITTGSSEIHRFA
jgi:ankyrin repeat protein